MVTEPLMAGSMPIVLIITGLLAPLLMPMYPVFEVNRQVDVPVPSNAFAVVPDEL